MSNRTDEEIMGLLIAIIHNGFNRSLGALERAGAIDTRKMFIHYKGMGSKYYDIVTEQMELAARLGIPSVRKLFSGQGEDSTPPDPDVGCAPDE